jgi:hypothetical protein
MVSKKEADKRTECTGRDIIVTRTDEEKGPSC